MKPFLTLVKREIADSRGSLIFTPVIISILLVLLLVLGMVSGSDKILSVEINGQGGPVSVLADLDTEERREGAAAAVFLMMMVSALIPLVMAVTAVFTLLGSLYEERKDRSILFWKSMPVSDFQVVLSKFAAPAIAGFGIALLCALVAHIVMVSIILVTGALLGVAGAGWELPVSATLEAWAVGGLVTLLYVLFVAPVYAWFLVASAAAPKSPFLIAFVPIAVLGLIEAALNTPFRISGHIFERLGGALIVSGEGTGSVRVESPEDISRLLGTETLASLSGAFLRAELWIGLLVAAGLLFLASEIRRRRLS